MEPEGHYLLRKILSAFLILSQTNPIQASLPEDNYSSIEQKY